MHGIASYMFDIKSFGMVLWTVVLVSNDYWRCTSLKANISSNIETCHSNRVRQILYHVILERIINYQRFFYEFYNPFIILQNIGWSCINLRAAYIYAYMGYNIRKSFFSEKYVWLQICENCNICNDHEWKMSILILPYTYDMNIDQISILKGTPEK